MSGIKAIYNHFELWEDYNNGMYCKENHSKEFVNLSRKLLMDHQLFYDSMVQMIFDWKFCIDENLSKRNSNRRSYLGMSTCNYIHGSPEYSTRLAWKELNQFEKNAANYQADIIIRKYESKNRAIHINLGKQMLF